MRRSLWTAVCAAALVFDVAACGAATGIPGDAPNVISDGAVATADVTTRSDAGGGLPVQDASGRDATRVDATARDVSAPPPDAAAETTTRDAFVDRLVPSDSTHDGAVPLSPDEVVAGHGITLFGVTDHGLIIYADAAGTCWAIAFGGGAPEVISPPSFMADAAGALPEVGISHDVVFMGVSFGAEGTAPLFAWSSASGGPHSLPNLMGSKGLTMSSASFDSRYVAYSWTQDFGEPWYVANVDGSDAAYLGYGTVLFDGSTAVFGQQCQEPCSASVIALDAANGWAKVVLSANAYAYAPNIAVDAIEQNVLFYQLGGDGTTGGLVLAPLDGGAPTLVDSNALVMQTFYLAPDSSLALYTTSVAGTSGAQLEAVMLPGGSPYTVDAVNALNVRGIDDVVLESPFGPIAVVAGQYGEAVVGVGPGESASDRVVDSFVALTADGSYALAFDGSEELVAIDLSGSPLDDPTVVATTLPPVRAVLSALDGTRVLFGDNFVAAELVTDLRVADVAAGGSSTLVTSAISVPATESALYALSPDTTQVAYVRNTGASTDGLYVTPVP